MSLPDIPLGKPLTEEQIAKIFKKSSKPANPITGGVIMPQRQVSLTHVYELISELEKRIAELESK